MLNINDILIKVITNNASEKEVSEVYQWINESVENKHYYNQIKELWESVDTKEFKFNPDEKLAWEKINKQLDKKVSINYFLKIAASIFILISVGLVVKFIITKPTDIEIIALAPPKALDRKQYIKSDNSIKETFLEDSSLVLLNSNSEINYEDFNSAKRIINLKGQAHFDVTHNNNDFIVNTANIIVKVVGTSFTVNEILKENIVEVIVDEGIVEVYEKNKTKNQIRIKKKEKYCYNILTHTFIKVSYSKKNGWWNNFISRLKNIGKKFKNKKH